MMTCLLNETIAKMSVWRGSLLAWISYYLFSVGWFKFADDVCIVLHFLFGGSL